MATRKSAAAAALAEPATEDSTVNEECALPSAPEDEDAYEGDYEGGYNDEGGEDDAEDNGEEDETTDSTKAPEQPDRLTGDELLAKAEEMKLEGKGVGQIAWACGYYSVGKNGQERVLKAQFNQALLAAQGFQLGGGVTGAGRQHRGRDRARVVSTGVLQVSQLAARQIGAEPGRVFSVEYPTGDLVGPGAQILLTMTEEIDAIRPRTRGENPEQPSTPLLGRQG